MIAITRPTRSGAERAKAAVASLPPFSPILNKLLGTLADDDVSFAEVGGILEKDAVLSGNVLRLVNSAAYGLQGEVNSVRHAVSMLGLEKVRNVAIGMMLNKMWNTQKLPAGWSSSQFNLHGVACAILADLLAAERRVDYPEGAFIAGLLQNTGMLLVAVGCPEEFPRIRQRYQGGTQPIVEYETEMLGAAHPELSAHTLRHWKLPLPIVEAVATHHGPHRGSPEAATLGYIVELADRLAAGRGILVQDWMRPEAESPEAILAPAGLAERTGSLLDAFEPEFEALQSYFQ